MMVKKILFLLTTVGLLGCGELLLAKKAAAKKENICGKNKKSCLEDKNCLCYCSRKCGPREKQSDDAPVYVENDPNGKYCYCKPWDRDKFEEQMCAKREEKEESAKK